MRSLINLFDKLIRVIRKSFFINRGMLIMRSNENPPLLVRLEQQNRHNHHEIEYEDLSSRNTATLFHLIFYSSFQYCKE